MNAPEPSSLKRTPLFDSHKALNGKLVSFGGWEMPVQYSGLVDEHVAVRTKAGLFDVSHMGEIRVRGPKAFEVVQKITCNDVAVLVDGRIQYSAFLTERGTFVDDLLTYRLAADDFLLVVNASSTPKDVAWAKSFAVEGATIEDESPAWSQIAIQGPLAQEILQPFVKADLSQVAYYWFTWADVLGTRCIVSRTGYTGEDGFEIYGPADAAPKIWAALIESGTPKGLLPAGLGARDTLRLEAKLALYGNDIDDTVTPWEADLGWIVKMKKGDFIGRDALAKQREQGLTKKLAGFFVDGRGIARHGYPLKVEGSGEAGVVTSGTQTPTVGRAVGLAYVPLSATTIGTRLLIHVRGKDVLAVVVPTPFYKRASAWNVFARSRKP